MYTCRNYALWLDEKLQNSQYVYMEEVFNISKYVNFLLSIKFRYEKYFFE